MDRFGSLKIVPVPPGHEHEPDELCANFDLTAGVVYVREEDWPLIRAELENLPNEAMMTVTKEMVDRFLNWKLPDSVSSDGCATQQGYPNRIGTNLLTAHEAQQMLEHVLDQRTEVGTQFKAIGWYDRLHDRAHWEPGEQPADGALLFRPIPMTNGSTS